MQQKMATKFLLVVLVISALSAIHQDRSVVEGLLCFDLSCASKMNALENQIARLIEVCRLNSTTRQSSTTITASPTGNLIDTA